MKPIKYILVCLVNGRGLGVRLTREDITFATPPTTRDSISWNDWTLVPVQYRYIGSDWIELGLPAVNNSEVDMYVNAGWTLRN